MKRKFLSILFILFLIAPVVVTFTYLHYQKKKVKKEVKWKLIEGVDKSDLVLLKFSIEETQTKLCWKHSKEFEYQNQMYDIVDNKLINDSMYYWCWWDYEETELNKKLKNLLSYALGHDNKTNESKKQLERFYKSLYHQDYNEKKFVVNNCILLKSAYVLFCQKIDYKPLTPPPKYV